MKCLLVASESVDLLFYWTDREFEQNLQEQYGVTQEEGHKPPAFEDRISTQFAPIIISCSSMIDKIDDCYTSFTTENNHIYVLHQFDECLYIAVNGDGDEKDEDLRRKIYVMKKLMEVHFGVVTLSSTHLRKELRPQDTDQRNRLWKKLQGLLGTYSQLREQDQSFLVEAVERLIHPTLCEQCIEFLERRLVHQINNSVERAGEEVLHAFILVHTKLLAFYSSRNASTLTSSDLLALILMVQNRYPSSELEDQLSEHEENTLVPEVFYTPEPSPTSGASGASNGEESQTPIFQFVDPDIQMAEDSLHTLEVPPPDPANPSRVFLEATIKEGFCPMMPHNMYSLQLWPGITLVLLTKIPNSQVAISVYYFLDTLASLEKRLSEGVEGSSAPRSPLPLHDLRSKMDKFIRALSVSDAQLVSQLQSTWAEFKHKAFSRGGPGVSKELLPCCRNMKTQLCGLFRQCFVLKSAENSQRLAPSLQERSLALVQEKLVDWKDFLLVKSKRNITMVSYLEEFPGLIHFIYVDRTAGQMIAPSFNVTDHSTSELGKGPLAHFIKSKVWSLVGTARHYMQKGYSTATFRDGDYYFCYFLWFENETGYKLDVIDLPLLPDDSAPIGMLAWDYYRKLLRYYSKYHNGEVVKCYELLTMHLGVIPSDYVLQHCCQLARKLWEPSRIPLL